MKNKRCRWAENEIALYQDYHDHEWGIPVHDDRHLFEMLILEGFQAGLSWLTILKKREAFREAFDGFNPEIIKDYTQEKIDILKQNEGIVRNKLKIAAAITNAKVFLDIVKQWESFDAYLWHFTKGRVVLNNQPPFQVTTPLSDEISKDLKKRGMKFVGSTIIYAYLQAVGVVNSHEPECYLHHHDEIG